VAPTLLELAEAPSAFVVPPHPAVVVGDGYYVMPRRPGLATVQRVRVAADRVEAVRHHAREIARGWSAERIEWALCALTEPADLASRLGLEHSETLAALALTSAPAGGDSFEVREVRTLEDYIQAQRVDARANGWPEGADEEYARFWEVARDRFIAWVAFDRGRPVGMARCATAEQALMMVGGAVLPEERGRGIYRALVAARWATAVERGVPALVTAANEQSAPILRRLGFAELGEIAVYTESV